MFTCEEQSNPQIENSLPQPKKFANFNEFSEIKIIRKNSYKHSLNR